MVFKNSKEIIGRESQTENSPSGAEHLGIRCRTCHMGRLGWNKESILGGASSLLSRSSAIAFWVGLHLTVVQS